MHTVAKQLFVTDVFLKAYSQEKISGELQMTFGQIIQWYVHPWDIIWSKARLTAKVLIMWNLNEPLPSYVSGRQEADYCTLSQENAAGLLISCS